MIIKHKRSMDVAFNAYKNCLDEDTLVLKGVWVNQGYVESWVINPKSVTISLKLTDLKNWSRCDSPQTKCLRNSSWSPF